MAKWTLDTVRKAPTLVIVRAIKDANRRAGRTWERVQPLEWQSAHEEGRMDYEACADLLNEEGRAMVTDEASLDAIIEDKRQFLKTFGVKVFDSDPDFKYKPWRMPLDGGKRNYERILAARKKEIGKGRISD